MTAESKPGRICPQTGEICLECTKSCKVQDLINWVNGLSAGSDSFGLFNETIPQALSGLSPKQVESFYKTLYLPPITAKDEKNLEPFKVLFGDFLR
jgi:hypothetical protein